MKVETFMAEICEIKIKRTRKKVKLKVIFEKYDGTKEYIWNTILEPDTFNTANQRLEIMKEFAGTSSLENLIGKQLWIYVQCGVLRAIGNCYTNNNTREYIFLNGTTCMNRFKQTEMYKMLLDEVDDIQR